MRYAVHPSGTANLETIKSAALCLAWPQSFKAVHDFGYDTCVGNVVLLSFCDIRVASYAFQSKESSPRLSQTF